MELASRTAIPAVSLFALTACGTGEGYERSSEPPVERVGTTAPQVATQPEITPQAATQLRAMSDYLAGLDQFTLHAEGTIEAVLENGQVLSFPYASDVKVRRPDGLRSDRVGELAKLQFYYDGRTFTLHGEEKNLYARADAPPTLDEAIEAARERFDLEAPGADLLYSNVYDVLTEDVISGFHVGMTTIDGVPVHHLAFRGNEVDWQIWIEDGPTPLPRRYSITSKNLEGSPQFTVDLSDWDTSPDLSDEVFEFSPPPGAQEIEFLPHSPPRPVS